MHLQQDLLKISANVKLWAWLLMELLQNLDLVFDVDAVLRGQGANPSILSARSPRLVKVAEKALQECMPMLHPKVVYQEFLTEGVKHERLMLQDGHHLQSRLLVQHLASASKVIVVLLTIGEVLEQQVSKLWDDDMVYALALEGAGSAAVEALANAACRYFEDQATKEGLQASSPFSPGMVEWPVSEGQPQIFKLLGEAGSTVKLLPSCVMLPRKSVTMVMGIGAEMKSTAQPCDYCSMHDTCLYRDHYLDRN
jgi:hypothetical protein